MNAIQQRIDTLQQYRPPLTARPDYASFWEELLRDRPTHAAPSTRTPAADTPLRAARAYKVAFAGYADTTVHGWFLLPPFDAPPEGYSCIVWFHGYTGSKGLPEDYAAWLLAGHAVFAIDVRGQGGETGDGQPRVTGMAKGWMSQGLFDPHTCYYKAITLDALQAIDWARAQPEVDPDRVVSAGASQGGGLALIATAFHPGVRLTVADIPNMCHMDYGILYSTGSLTEAADLLNRFPDRLDDALATLSYYDVMNAADRIRVPTLVSVGLKDTVCMPETVFAAYNRIASPVKEIVIYPFAGHFTGHGHFRKAAAFIDTHLRS